MKLIAVTLRLPFVMLFTLTLPACEREAPQKPVGTATNKHVEESSASPYPAANTMTEALKSSVEKAHQAEDAVHGAAESTSKQAEHTTQ